MKNHNPYKNAYYTLLFSILLFTVYMIFKYNNLEEKSHEHGKTKIALNLKDLDSIQIYEKTHENSKVLLPISNRDNEGVLVTIHESIKSEGSNKKSAIIDFFMLLIIGIGSSFGQLLTKKKQLHNE